MDEMTIVSKFTTSIISKLLKASIKKKIGYDIDIKLNEIRAVVANGKTSVHLDVDACMNADEMNKLVSHILQ